VPQDRPVLERARLALGAVGDDDAGLAVAAGLEDRQPLPAGPEPGAAPAPQSRQVHLLGGAPRADRGGGAEAVAAASGPELGEGADGIAGEDDARGEKGVGHGVSGGSGRAQGDAHDTGGVGVGASG
jgi:hypothetical protein